MTVDHLTPPAIRRAHRHLVAKALAEFAHERLIEPAADGDDWAVTAGESTYRFAAQRFRLEHWVIDPASIVRTAPDGTSRNLDALELIVELSPVLGIGEKLLPLYLEEVGATLAAGAWKLTHHALGAKDLVEADLQTVEAAMTEGHPAFVANNGRIGFDVEDHARYAPEAGGRIGIVWVAVRRDLGRLSLGRGVTEQALYDDQVDRSVREAFDDVLKGHGLEPADYLLAPVHPWQWRTKIAVTLASEIARQRVILVGTGPEVHQPQQSIRTLFDTADPSRHYVKTALSIQNMGFMRGLSPRYMAVTPAINDHVADVVAGDPELAACGFRVLRELASFGYTGDVFQQLPFRTPYQAMFAALWRESPVPLVGEGDQLATMAALLHRDADGNAYVTATIEASGVSGEEWVRAYLDVYLRPLVHLLVGHDLAFMPHGENLILVLRDHLPVGAFLKDIGEEVAYLGDGDLAEEVSRIRMETPEDVAGLAVLTDMVDGFLRYLAGILAVDGVLAEDAFWALVGDCLDRHLADHPDLAARAVRYDLRRPVFRHSCLNRLQLRNTLQMVDLADQAESLIFAGTLENPFGRA